MRPNPLRDKLRSGEVALGAWLAIPSSVSAEAIGAAGYDYVCVDMQHGLVDYSDSVGMLQAVGIGHSTPVARVPENQAGHIGKALDAGAMAVIVPMVNTPEQCEAAMTAARYAPRGSRSYGPTRVAAAEGADYFDQANEDILLIPMIETVEAVEAIDDILSVPGVEAVYVGPADLGVSMGLGPAAEEPGYHDILDRIVAACQRHDVTPGIHTNTATSQDRLDRGFQMVTITSDLASLRASAAKDLDMVRRGRTGEQSSIY